MSHYVTISLSGSFSSSHREPYWSFVVPLVPPKPFPCLSFSIANILQMLLPFQGKLRDFVFSPPSLEAFSCHWCYWKTNCNHRRIMTDSTHGALKGRSVMMLKEFSRKLVVIVRVDNSLAFEFVGQRNILVHFSRSSESLCMSLILQSLSGGSVPRTRSSTITSGSTGSASWRGSSLTKSLAPSRSWRMRTEAGRSTRLPPSEPPPLLTQSTRGDL